MTDFKCDTCGDIEVVLIHGYDFADRPLEGVMIEVRIIDGQYVARVRPQDLEYFDSARLSVSKVQKDAAEFAFGLDVAECPSCGEDVALPTLHPHGGVIEQSLPLTSGAALASMLHSAYRK